MLPNNAHFKIWFKDGGCGAFLNSWRFCLDKIRNAAMSNVPVDLGREIASQ